MYISVFEQVIGLLGRALVAPGTSVERAVKSLIEQGVI